MDEWRNTNEINDEEHIEQIIKTNNLQKEIIKLSDHH